MNFHRSERPWTEEEWPAEFRRSDVRSARFGELLETLRDHPDRDDLIAREMGWDRVGDLFTADDAAEIELECAQAASSDEPSARTFDPLHDGDELDRAAGLPLLSEAAAFRLALEVTAVVIESGRGFEGSGFADVRHEEAFRELTSNALIPAAKIRGGHCFGYDDEICANIVCNRSALEAAEKAEQALLRLDREAALPAAYAERLLPRLRELIRLLNERITAMRSRVWW